VYTLCSVRFCSFLELLGVEAFLHSECVLWVVWFCLVSLSMAGPASAAIGFFLGMATRINGGKYLHR